jgi:nucleoside-diphosphate-sugar epimerase
MLELADRVRPALIVHCAAQPSHDLAAQLLFDDFDVNAVGTLNLLEAARRSCLESPFVFLSTNKVYGDAPNELPLVELETRLDVLVQEYGRYFGMPTVCLRGGCLTGPNHAGAELHGFLDYLARAVGEARTYRIFGYKGKQVRDNIHSFDVCRAIMAFAERPSSARVYNLGGGRANSISVLEAIARFEEPPGRSQPDEAFATSGQIRLPSLIARIRSAVSATRGSFVTSRIVIPYCSRSRCRSARMCAPVTVSSAPVGSSARSNRGSFARARAVATRWRSPPESVGG